MAAYHENLIFDNQLPVKIILHTDVNWKKRTVLSHWHNSIEVCYIVKGQPGDARINGQKYHLQPHQLYLIGPNIIHSFDTVVTQQAEILTLLIPLTWLSDQFDYFNKAIFQVGPVNVDHPGHKLLEKQLQTIIDYKRSKNPSANSKLQTVGALHYIAYLILGKMIDEKTEQSNDLELGSPLLIQQLMSKIQHDYQHNLMISQLSEDNHISETHLIRIFKKYVGVSPKNYLIQIRFDEAKQLLHQTSMSVEEIAQKTGFGSAKNFFVLFHKRFDKIPNEYRHKNKQPESFHPNH